MYPKSILALALIFYACNPSKSLDRPQSAKIKRVVIVGNSIVQHPPLPSIQWYNNCGMAASDISQDFVHLLMKDIQVKDSSIQVQFKNISDFERNYIHYDFSQIDSLKGADMYIIRICENVSYPAPQFFEYYDKLISFLDTKTGVKVIVDGFWDKPLNKEIKEYASSHNYIFVLNSDLKNDETNTAKGLYPRADVGEHPSDKGMLAIEKRIWEQIGKYF